MSTPKLERRTWPARSLLAGAGGAHLLVALGFLVRGEVAGDPALEGLEPLAWIPGLFWVTAMATAMLVAAGLSIPGFMATLGSGENGMRRLAPAALTMVGLCPAELLGAPGWGIAAGALAGLALTART